MKHPSSLIAFFLTCCLCGGCVSQTRTKRYVTFPTTDTFGSRLIFQAAKSATSGVIERPAPSEKTLTGLSRLKDLGAEFLYDLGGLAIRLETEDGEAIEGIYFDPDLYKSKQTGAYKKWKAIFNIPRNSRLVEMFELELSARSLLSLFGLPNTIKPLHSVRKHPLGALVLPEYGLTFQLDPKMILSCLARGMHVFAINYRGEDKIPNWKVTCNDTDIAYNWLKAHLKCPNKDLVVIGKSFGTGPAIYLGTQHEKLNLILERPFARMSDLCEYTQHGPIVSLASPFAKSFIEKYFRYPNEDWIVKVSGKILFLESSDDKAIEGHTRRLVDALTAPFKEEAKRAFQNRYWIRLRGSHFGRFWGDTTSTWYVNEANQDRIHSFLEEL